MYRVGNHQPQNVYRDDRYIGVMFSPETAAEVVATMNDRYALAEFRDKLAALAAIEDYIGESGQNAARNIRELLSGEGADGNDPRVQARAWGLEW